MGADQGLIEKLRVPPVAGSLRLELLGEVHHDRLAAACAEDPDIWAIYPASWDGEHFDETFRRSLADSHRIGFAVIDDGRLVGMSAYIDPDPANATVEIGGSYLRPAVRGTGLNARLKRLMIDHGFACGVRRIAFRIDVRNARSQAAIRGIGAVHEGVLRQDRVTWTGHVRDTAIFSIVQGEWQK